VSLDAIAVFMPHRLLLGCYINLGNYEKAKELLDAVPDAMEKKKISGKDLPTEVFIKKKSS
jgi:hypothetical protein